MLETGKMQLPHLEAYNICIIKSVDFPMPRHKCVVLANHETKEHHVVPTGVTASLWQFADLKQSQK